MSKTGFWIVVDDYEYFVPFDDYPIFQEAKVSEIFDFERDGNHLHWPQLDADIELEALEQPE